MQYWNILHLSIGTVKTTICGTVGNPREPLMRTVLSCSATWSLVLRMVRTRILVSAAGSAIAAVVAHACAQVTAAASPW